MPCTTKMQQNKEPQTLGTVTLPVQPEDSTIVRGDDFTPHPVAKPQPPPIVPEHVGHEERSITETKKPRGKTRKKEEDTEGVRGSTAAKRGEN
jgi:hypothetical protein